MTYQVTATQARTISSTDQVVYNEVDVINRKIIEQALLGELQATIDTGTTMTGIAGGAVTVTGLPFSSTGTPAQFFINGVAINISADVEEPATIGTAVTTIENANVPGLVVSQVAVDGDPNDAIQLVYTGTNDVPNLTITDGANENFPPSGIGLTAGVTEPEADTNAPLYYQVWSGTIEDRKKSYEMAQVIQHFQDAGYNILRKQNTDTSNTIKWEVYW